MPRLTPAARLHALAGAREALRPVLLACWERISAGADDAALASWAEAALDLAEANAGAACLAASWRVSAELRPSLGLPALAHSLRAAGAVCRAAGAGAALACLEALPAAARATPDTARWWACLRHLAGAAPESVAAVAARNTALLRPAGCAGMADFVAAGLKLHPRQPAARRRFFSLEDPVARRLLEGLAGGGLGASERVARLFLAGLWGPGPELRAMPDREGPPPRRATLSGHVVLVPHHIPGVPEAAAQDLSLAIAAHAGAHIAFASPRAALGALKPLQLTLTTLLEDARVEALAMARFPGLRAL